jgi:nicotinate-nucleotide adenylyltransferase
VPRWGDRRAVRIGLLGGSFNPAHDGHRHIAELARRRLRLDQVWLLVSPGNPLKPVHGMAAFAQRLAGAARIADGRRIVATGIEARLGTRYTVDTLRALRRRFPRARFVWLMGADILAQLPRWRRWREIAALVSFAVLPRPSYNPAALAGLAAKRLRRARQRGGAAAVLARVAPPAWTFLSAPEHAASATAIRAAGPPYSQDTRTAKECTTIARKPPTAEPPKPRGAKPAARPRPRPAAPAGAPLPAVPGTPRKKAVVAGPKAPRQPRRTPAAANARLDRLHKLIVASLEDDKAEAIISIDLAGRASFADRMVIATGLADRQIAAMAQHLEEKLHDASVARVQVEGTTGSDWVLIDAGDIVIHLFKPEARAMYGLEKMWGAELDEADAG